LVVTDRRYFEESNMSLKGVVDGYSLQRWILTITILCASVLWTSAGALAQAAAFTALTVTAHSTSWSLERQDSNTPPHLVIGMSDRGHTLPHASLRIAREEGTNPSAVNEMTRQVVPAASANRTERIESDRLVLSSLFDSTAGIRGSTEVRAQPASPGLTIQKSPDLMDAGAYSLVDGKSAPGTFLYAYQTNYLSSKQWLADNEAFAHEVGQAPRPLMQLEFGEWRFPVVLSSTGISQ
jgi:hypothetical protein